MFCGSRYRLCPANHTLDEECFQRTPLRFVGQQSMRWGGVGGKQIFYNGTYVSEGTVPPGSVWSKLPMFFSRHLSDHARDIFGGAGVVQAADSASAVAVGLVHWRHELRAALRRIPRVRKCDRERTGRQRPKRRARRNDALQVLRPRSAGAGDRGSCGDPCESASRRVRSRMVRARRPWLPRALDLSADERAAAAHRRWDCEQSTQVWSSCSVRPHPHPHSKVAAAAS